MDTLEAYSKMLVIRRFEERVEELFSEGRVMGTAHTCIGQESVAVGMAAALTSADAITTTHRGHGHFLAMGGDPKRIMAEIFGKDAGYSHGYGGSQMMMAPGLGFYGANGITAGSTAFAAGLALESKMNRRRRVVVCILGDGASNQGILHESLNLASLWKLPVVYLVENNGYAMSTPTAQGLSNIRVADRAAGYSIAGRRVDGNDFFVVRDAVSRAIESARLGNGPSIVECVTYRLSGHSKGDQRTYRSREEEAAAWRVDPIIRFQNRLLAETSITDDQIQSFTDEARRIVDEAVAYAENAPAATPQLFRNRIFA